jgi:hypothetical protein
MKAEQEGKAASSVSSASRVGPATGDKSKHIESLAVKSKSKPVVITARELNQLC